MSHTVGPVARMAGITVRTLHHYDEIGLLKAGGRSEAGYRRYDDGDLERLQRMASAVEKAMEADTMGISLTPEERFEVFGDFNPDEHAAEVDERWSATDPYRESTRRAASYSKEDWQRIKAQGQAAIEQVVAAMNAAKPADSSDALEGAEAHRRQITDSFYDCSYEMHVGLAEMYIADPRFTATYEKFAPGLAQYLHDAIKANAARGG